MPENIAIYDDDIVSVDQYDRLLERHDYHIQISASGVASALGTLSRLSEEKIFAVLVDKSFPDGDGDTVVKGILALNLGIPLIGISNQYDVAGVDRNIYKSGKFSVLVEYLNSLR